MLSATIVFLIGLAFIWRPFWLALRKDKFAETRRSFHWQRERLEAKFVQLAEIRSEAEGVSWSDCYFEDDVSYVWNRYTSELFAFVAVVVVMKSESDPLEEITLSPQLFRQATAVFRFDGQRWSTDGRAILNLNPAEAIQFYRRDLRVVGRGVANRN